MAHFDLPLDQLRTYYPTVEQPDDFDGFWSTQLEEASRHGIDATVDPAGDLIRSADVLDVRFSGHGGDRVAAWLYLPHETADGAPVVVEYIGYNGGRGRPIDWLRWSSVGYPHLVVDSRGQGGGWRSGDTPDPGDTGEPGSRGFVTRGLSDPMDHYYSRLFVDAARAWKPRGRSIPLPIGLLSCVVGAREVRSPLPRQVSRSGRPWSSQTCLSCPTFAGRWRSQTRRRSQRSGITAPHTPIGVGTVFRTLSYFDVVNHAKRVTAPSLFSVALMDEITPPSTVFAAYNNLGGERRIEVYEFNGHEGGGSAHFEKQVGFVREYLG